MKKVDDTDKNNAELLKLNKKVFRENASLKNERDVLKKELAALLEENKYLKVKLYGQSSEKFVNPKDLPDEDKIFNEAEIAPTEDEASDEDEVDKSDSTDSDIKNSAPKKKRKPKRTTLPKNLPRQSIEIDLKEEDKVCACGCQKNRIGEEITEKLEVIPAQCFIQEYIRYKYACKNCETGVSIAPMPDLFLPKSIAGSGLVAQTAINKYANHLPLYRQEGMWDALDLKMPRNTLCNWLMNAYEKCMPLWHVIKTKLQSDSYLQSDETPVQVLAEEDRTNKQKSFMWVYQSMSTDNRLVLFDYQETRAANNVKGMLEKFKGYLQTDAYKGYDWVDKESDITHLGCMAHARRPFAELVKTTKKIGKSHQAIAFFRQLYAVEKEARVKKLAAQERFQLRLDKSLPVLNKLNAWLETSIKTAASGSKLHKAIEYMLNHWDVLTNYLKDGRLEIDNNSTERQIRPFALGKKNWLFAASPRGAKASSLFYSLIASAKCNDLKPCDYLKYVFDNIGKCKTTADFERLLPFNCNLPKKIDDP